jgi:hypothetical protein
MFEQEINAKNHWLLGILLSSGILGTRKHDGSETDPVSETSRFLDDGKSPKT